MTRSSASSKLKTWLRAARHGAGSYRLLWVVEEPEARDEGLKALRHFVTAAHQDAVDRLRGLVGISLDPLESDMSGSTTVIDLYPQKLHTITLQGYLGEIFAALVAEHFQPHGRAWVTPAYLFRFDDAAQQELERQRQGGEISETHTWSNWG